MSGDGTMEVCARAPETHAYHDGELPAEARAAFEAHLASCPACSRELQELRALSRLLAETGLPDAPAGMEARLHRTARAAGGYGVVRMAESLAALAAAVLIVLGGWLLFGAAERRVEAAPYASWERAAVTLRDESSLTDAQRFAQWIVEDLSVETPHD